MSLVCPQLWISMSPNEPAPSNSTTEVILSILFPLPISFFHVIFGNGAPSARQGNSTFCPSVTSWFEGFSSQDGGTETHIDYHHTLGDVTLIIPISLKRDLQGQLRNVGKFINLGSNISVSEGFSRQDEGTERHIEAKVLCPKLTTKFDALN